MIAPQADAVVDYVRENHDRYLDELKIWIANPSISANPAHHADVRRSAEAVVARMRAAGLTAAEVLETDGLPVAYGSWLHAPGAPTILIYGHHDVQPADPFELWTSPPFVGTVRDGNIFGRGAVDDKGQVLMHLAALEAHLRDKRPAAAQRQSRDRRRGRDRFAQLRGVSRARARTSGLRCRGHLRYRGVRRGRSVADRFAARLGALGSHGARSGQ